ncbi:hypothetical protein H1Z61_07420 [Bacillus aquiflavi]|uniref:Uncharacterized protein n=1 Tax=Bacillus aquiflavi TaxID=2672567 RepID=A0A6B3W5G3_9BACI|nr:hypothetical protein [Bacillus aquiflavi]MBA4536978.1 hypothetical protein [Bacillus aquiflavi]NEY82674.1 hypothetical protein [Bacillus aquiflavi]
MGQYSLEHRFEHHEDVTGKSAVFSNQLNRMGALSVHLANFINNEFQNSNGEVIKESKKAIQLQLEEYKTAINEYISKMKTLAIQYNSQVNEMKKQRMTIYYEEKEEKITGTA